METMHARRELWAEHVQAWRDIDLSLPAERVVRALDQVIEWRGKPQAIRSDNGPEYISSKLVLWAEKHGVRLEYIQPA